ncbi:MAG: FAD-dependent oxidoreductase, partial [Propionicimonas sp.]
PELSRWRSAVSATRSAPPFVVLRLWFSGRVDADRPAFLGTSGYGPLDNVSVLERFEDGAAAWSQAHGGSVVELHAYAAGADVQPGTAAAQAVADELLHQLHLVFPETAGFTELHRELLVADDCTLIDPSPWRERPGVVTPVPGLVLAGDWVRADYPVALMERAATTGILAANELLAGWGVRGEGLWTVPMQGVFARGQRAATPARGA